MPGTFPALSEFVDAYEPDVTPMFPGDRERRWYTQRYLPLARAVNERGLLRHYPGEQMPDIVARILSFGRHVARRRGAPLDLPELLEAFTGKKLERDKKEMIGHAHSGRLHRGRPAALVSPPPSPTA